MKTVFVSVLPRSIFNETVDTTPKVFATRNGAQADCDALNARRMSHNTKFVVREMEVHL